MPWTTDRAASRHGRDRDLFPDGPRVGPYEAPYDVRRGYQQPRRPAGERPPVDVAYFRAREDRGDAG